MTITTKLFGLLAIGLMAATAFAGITSAQTYYYVSTDGSLKAAEADTANQVLANATDIQTHSGVITKEAYNRLKGGNSVVIKSNTSYQLTASAATGETYNAESKTYLYVNSSDELMSVRATNSEQAINIAPNIKYNSGVMLNTK